MSEPSLTIDNILAPELTLCKVPASSKKRVLEFIAERIHFQDEILSDTQIFNNLVSRERLGSTGIGEGIAIPHCRLEGLDRVIGVLMTLEEPVDFDAIDNQPVDLVFALIVPKEATSEHLELLSQLAERFNDSTFCARLRQCEDAANLYQRMAESHH
ncbi:MULTISPECIES: PTS IIA-like nitrogen regulatory protein PtsN [Marinobacter]|jgi:PTS system nitrogen regulatory IIA component|uniref:PTS IIA-like nitrogen regulatory protein PtsN n=1 Tax=Marinobacter TaxID=2742 RepID=UPI001D18DA89|nr:MULTISPECIES: PTS IIA-like nitrogen regulatory protein PtsN [Marinobacter]MCC4270387.1 PTS IIA-like nitrogen regulatory protein PtsN [Marinobacter nauticus]MCW9011685.1 PTS IIA-like nitrogen regulatory protein PtsN [Marinobacter sp.]MEC8822916.1 PTS IIA-like nitrogen regulatory protein PtsN [Pseudomonadota bacterium]